MTDREIEILDFIFDNDNTNILDYVFSDEVNIDEDKIIEELHFENLLYYVVNYSSNEDKEYLFDNLEVDDYFVINTTSLDKQRMLDYLIYNIKDISLEDLETIINNK